MEVKKILKEHIDKAKDKACFTCSFQVEDVVILHLLLDIKRDIPVLFIDTGYHFQEVYEFINKLHEEWKFNLKVIKPDIDVEDFEKRYGKLYESDPNLCCKLRKVEPLFREIKNYDLWITGLRREQSPTRANLEIVENIRLPDGKEITKLNPLAHWTWKEVWNYTVKEGLPYLKLYDEGYTSIGCKPCTSLPVRKDDLRSGRWGGKKLECGIHTFYRE